VKADPSTRRLSPWLAKIILEKSPKHALAALDEPFEETEALRFGRVVDQLVFGGLPPGAPPPRPVEMAVARAASIKLTAEYGPDRPWNSQAKLEWTADGGVLCKGRPDLIAGTDVVDLKTASDLSDDAITRSIERYGYDLQLAAYCEGVTAMGLVDRPVARLLFVEKSRPFDVRLVTLGADLLGAGTARWRKACTIWKDCLSTGNWPGRGEMTAHRSPWRARSEARDTDAFPDVK